MLTLVLHPTAGDCSSCHIITDARDIHDGSSLLTSLAILRCPNHRHSSQYLRLLLHLQLRHPFLRLFQSFLFNPLSWCRTTSQTIQATSQTILQNHLPRIAQTKSSIFPSSRDTTRRSIPSYQ